MMDARQRYAIPRWSEGLFDINHRGEMTICLPQGTQSLVEVVNAATQQSLRLPLLVRFPQILQARAQALIEAFNEAMAEAQYDQPYRALYPIKVNQQASVVHTLANIEGMGLEVGSKPELITALAIAKPGTTIVCNGYKDRAYIKLALAGQKIGLETLIVIEKASEWAVIEKEATAMGLTPRLGVRVRLASLGAGKWQNTGGERAKFGLSAHQLLALIESLKSSGKADWLKLLHFHMGSQISNLRDIAKGTEEAARFFVAMAREGLSVEALDIGGGLGVDYEGGGSRSYCSMNYSLKQYAQTIAETLSKVCREANLSPPRLYSESGRALSAHHAVLITHVTATESRPPLPTKSSETEQAHEASQKLRQLLDQVDTLPPEECFHEATHWLEEGKADFLKGAINLTQRAQLEPLHAAVIDALQARLDVENDRHRKLRDQIRLMLSEKYFINLSIFQSLPDIWAIDQVFPIVPLARLNEAPTHRAVLEDLTCDSDGRIDHYVDRGLLETTLAVHEIAPNERYLLGIFLAGAYQETLGDIHNLFGDTDTVDVWLSDRGMKLEKARHGDSADALLRYVGYDPQELMVACQDKVDQAHLPPAEAKALAALLTEGLKAYTYLEIHDE
jgi:arginine decarboxylase